MIDDLYGEGAWDRLVAAFPAPKGTTVTVGQDWLPDDGARVYAKWHRGNDTAGVAAADCHPDRVIFTALHLDDALQQQGVLTGLVDRFAGFMEQAGVEWVEVIPATRAAHEAFEATGAEPVNGTLGYRTAGPRRKEYVAWKKRKGRKPEWRKAA